MLRGRRANPSWLVLAAMLAVAVLPASLRAQTVSTNPSYTVASIVHAATQTVEALAPNTIATVYGTNLSYTTRSIAASDLNGGTLPTSLDGVGVTVNGIPANLFFVSPGQINFLIPYELAPGVVTLYVARQGLAGPVVKIQLNSTAPGLFPWGGNLAIATHLNGSLISAASPAAGGEIIVIYAAGLGRTTPDTTSGRVAPAAAEILAAPQMQVMLAGTSVPPANILYAGLAPGFAGLYQINLKLPAGLPVNPEIRIAIGSQISPALVQLAAGAPAQP